MGILDQFRGKKIFVDSMAFIYFIEEYPKYVDVVAEIFTGALERNEWRILTSAISVAEVLVHPCRLNNIELAREYEEILFGMDCCPYCRLTKSRHGKRLESEPVIT